MDSYDKNIFINCPFDEDYYSILRPLLFTVLYHGFTPRIALESSDSGLSRLSKIQDLIGQSMYSIHDLSRLKADKKHEFYRLNMSFELGIDFGCRTFSSANHSEKRFLILEKGDFRYMKALSDINGFDIKSHKNEPQELIKSIRNWFVETVNIRDAKSPTVIWYKFNDFWAYLYDTKKSEGFVDNEINFMPIPEMIDNMQNWLSKN